MGQLLVCYYESQETVLLLKVHCESEVSDGSLRVGVSRGEQLPCVVGLDLWVEVRKEAGVGVEERTRIVMSWEGDTVGLFVDKAYTS